MIIRIYDQNVSENVALVSASVNLWQLVKGEDSRNTQYCRECSIFIKFVFII